MKTPVRTLHRLALGAAAGTLGMLSVIAPAGAAERQSPRGALADLSLEELADIPVVSATRYFEPTSEVPSAIFVITGEDLRRSAVSSIPEALRLVPGVQVGRVDANKWAVSMRGFNSREANKLLVLVDGRSIYDPLFSGMLWESQDFLLEDIERIEVIRGPGGTLWGANAFNGVINIITRNARDTHGAYASLALGNEDRYIAAGRYGWQPREDQDARVYVKARERDSGFSGQQPPFDALRDVRGGFRWDWAGGGADQIRISGDIFEARSGIREDPALVQNVLHRGRNVLARWRRQTSDEGSLRLQLYYDHVDYDSQSFDQERDTYDLEFQQTARLATRHLLVWGGGYRRMHDRARTAFPGFVDVLPPHREDELWTVFAQDTIGLVPDALDLVVGLKYESTDYADAEWLPSVRLAWTARPGQTWWAAVSEATRVPSRLEADLTFLGSIRIGDEFGAEQVRAYEAGHRRLISPRLWLDLAVFYNDYDDLRTGEANGTLRNFMRGHTSGAELAVRWEPQAWWRLDGAYTYLGMELEIDPQSTSGRGLISRTEGLVARHQFSVRSAVELGPDVDVDATARYVDELEALAIPDYTQLDLAVSWRPRPGLSLAVVGQNLLDSHQPEQAFAFSASGMATEVQRSVYLRAIWRQ